MRHIPFFLTLSRESQRNTLEALIFACDEPLTPRTLYKVLILEDGVNSSDDPKNDSLTDSFSEDTAAEIVHESSLSSSADAAGDEVEGDSEISSVDRDENVDALSADADESSTTLVTKAEKKSDAKKKGIPDLSQLSALVAELAKEINDELIASERPYRVVRIAGGYQFATTSEFGEVVARLMKSRTRRRLSQAALEALAIIAYKQPISKPEIEAIRGINSNEVINSLVEKNLVTLAGRSDAPGKPLLYGTTDDFLRMFGLHSTKDLPKLRELDDLFQNKAAELASGLDISVKTTSGELLEKIQAMVDNEQKIGESERIASESEDGQEIASE